MTSALNYTSGENIFPKFEYSMNLFDSKAKAA
jgi:hypothetical protein